MARPKLKTTLVENIVKKKGEEVYLLTALGLETVRTLAMLHSSEDEIALYLGVPMMSFRRMLDPEHPI